MATDDPAGTLLRCTHLALKGWSDALQEAEDWEHTADLLYQAVTGAGNWRTACEAYEHLKHGPEEAERLQQLRNQHQESR